MLWVLAACGTHDMAVSHDVSVPTPIGPGLSDAVARVVDSYPVDGTFGFHWPPDDGVWWGTTRDVRYRGVLLSPADPEHRSHCVGLTWEVAMGVLSEAAGGEDEPINSLSLVDMVAFRKDWFVREVYGAGASAALARFGVGGRVPFDELRRGDFLQMWTPGGAGHSSVFDRWERDGETIVGVRYWSTHPLLGGVGYWSDSFGAFGIDRDRLYGARLARREEWVPREPNVALDP